MSSCTCFVCDVCLSLFITFLPWRAGQPGENFSLFASEEMHSQQQRDVSTSFRPRVARYDQLIGGACAS